MEYRVPDHWLETLRPYQLTVVHAILRALTPGQRIMVEAPTGSGKTIIMAAVVSALPGVRIWIIVPRIRLREQAVARLCVAHTELVRRSGHGAPPAHSSDVLVATYQTLVRGHSYERPDVIIVDECHLVPEDGSYAKLLQRYPDAAIVGLTATPFRDNQLITALGQGWRQVHSISMIELIRGRYLVPPISIGTADISVPALDLTADGRLSPTVIRKVRASIRQQGRSRPIVFCRDISHAELVARLLCDEGETDVQVVHSQQGLGAQRAALKAFERCPGRSWLVNVNLVSIGVDIPAIDAVVILRHVTSLAMFMQMVGRGLRPDKHKADCAVYDFGGGTQKFGFLDDPRLAEVTDEIQGRPGPVGRRCPVCNASLAAGALSCDRCGHQLERSESLREDSIQTELLSVRFMTARRERVDVDQDANGTWVLTQRFVGPAGQMMRALEYSQSRPTVDHRREYRIGEQLLVEPIAGDLVRVPLRRAA